MKLEKKRNRVLDLLIVVISMVIISNATIFSLPAGAFYGTIISGFIFVLLYRQNIKSVRSDLSFILIVLVAFVSLAVNNVDPIFNAYPRLLSYIVLLLLCSPLISNETIYIIRAGLLEKILIVCVCIVLISLFGLLLGLIPLNSEQETNGGFSGITNQSLILAPISAISILYALFKFNKAKTLFWKSAFIGIILLIFFVLLITGSRSSLGAVSAAIIMFYYILNGNKLTSIFRVLVFFLFIASASFPLWFKYTEVLTKKNELAKSNANVFSSRSYLWNSRLEEFNSSPIVGIGIGTVDLKSPNSGYHYDSGNVESGSSWLFILSSTGLLGMMLFILIFFKGILGLSSLSNKEPLRALYASLLIFFAIHMLFEGYIFAAGNPLTYLLYLTFSLSFQYIKIVKPTNG